jgi:uncharacterized protein YecA (UPF0149 family)
MKVVKDQNEIVSTEPKEKKYVPKIVICPDYKSLELVKQEFIAMIGPQVVGMCLCTLKEAIEHKLPIREAQKSFKDLKPHDIYLANTVDELVPDDYQDQKEIIDLDSVVKYFFENERKQERNKPCLCESGKKFKHCCINVN